LAPTPDFRYVGLEPSPRLGARTWASLAATGATLGAGALHALGLRGALVAAVAASAAALALRRTRGPSVTRVNASRGSERRDGVAMAIVPWGVLVQPDLEPRILRWAAVKRVHVEMIHGRDGGTPTTLWSIVTIETNHERFAGRAAGAIAIERLVAHVDAYADEQAHAIALDLDGSRAADGPHEPVIESLLAAARSSALGGRDGMRLGLPMGYRNAGSHASIETIDVLRGVLCDRSPRSPDPRALAAVLAAELGASPLTRELQSLVQSPHPIVAAVAKAAAGKLGVDAAKVGAVSEVAPFLHDADVDALQRWAPASLAVTSP
jgi:hypothetical protein